MSFFGGSTLGAAGSQTQKPSFLAPSSSWTFGGGSLLGSSQAQQQQQPQQQQQTQQQQQQQTVGGESLFNVSLAQSSPWQLQSTATQGIREKSIAQRLAEVSSKWLVTSPECVFQYYFYNKVPDEQAVYFRPGPNENEAKWEEALSKKPGKGYVPVLCVGFQQLSQRILLQGGVIAALNGKLHEINNSLTVMLQNHDLVISVRAEELKRRHVLLAQKCLTLATKTQILRNRGYAMGNDEEELKRKLTSLESSIFDPSIGGRAEEVWARMLAIRERSKLLQAEMDRLGEGYAQAKAENMDDARLEIVEKILEDHAAQLRTLKKELDSVSSEFKSWQDRNKPSSGTTVKR